MRGLVNAIEGFNQSPHSLANGNSFRHNKAIITMIGAIAVIITIVVKEKNCYFFANNKDSNPRQPWIKMEAMVLQ